MSNSSAQHFLASGNPAAAGTEQSAFSAALPNQDRASLTLDLLHGLTASSSGTPEEQAHDLFLQAKKKSRERKLGDAIYLLCKALELDGNSRVIHSTLGELYEVTGQPEKAILSHINAWKIEPHNSKCLSHIGSYLMRVGQDEEAINYFEAALKFDADNQIAFARMNHLKKRRCDWSDFGKTKKRLKILSESKQYVDPFSCLTMTDDPGVQKKFSLRAAKASCVKEDDLQAQPPRGQDGKIRIGYFSSDYRDHATMHLFGRQLELHDRSRFEIYIYDYGDMNEHEGRKRAERAADVYRQVSGHSNESIVSAAREDGLDIAVDLKGYTQGSRFNLFDQRLAPVQVSYLGYPGTTGVKTMDYMVADTVTIPPKLRKYYTEKILYMPECYQANDDLRKPAGTLPTRASAGLPEDAVVFCSFNAPYKVSPQEFDIWMKLLTQVPDSVLWFYAPLPETQVNILKEAESRGVSKQRIVFAGYAGQEEHLARMQLADIFLDTFNVNAHTTASDALWAGVPVVTKAGKQFAARVAASLLTNVGVPELITPTFEKYQSLALKLARDPEYLADVKKRVKQGISTGPLFDTATFTRNFETLMEKTLERYNAGLQPDHISLA